MHVLYEIFAEGDKEQYAENTAEQRAEEDLEEADGDFGIFVLKYVESRQGEDGSRPDRSDRLYDHILPQGVFLAERAGKTHGDDGDGDGGFENLSHLQAEICRGRTENDT